MSPPRLPPALGALVEPDGVRLRVWAPHAQHLELVTDDCVPPRPLERRDDGYFEAVVQLAPGALYLYLLDDGRPLPDPASRFQPSGVHGPSEVIAPGAFSWTDANWTGVPQRELVFYELHVGTFTPEGTFAAACARLPLLRELGVTAVELMPVADFPGRWNWGYDHAALYAPSRAYGRPDDLRALVDAAHGLGLAVFLDVIHNHLGPDGAYACAYAPMHSSAHRTPWGPAIDLDGPGSRGVRDFLCDSALHWLREYHADGLRLDATHALCDDSEPHFLAELADAVATLPGHRRYLIAEDSRNQRVLLEPRTAGGYGMDAVWADDFHHQIRNITAGDADGYFAPFAGTTAADLAETINRGWWRTGGPHGGTDPAGLRPERFVWCIQNHDQIGNRPDGARLNHQIDPALYRAVSALLLFAPQLPLLFMGQEWAASTPFQYFTDHHGELGKQVSAGRKEEFRAFPGFHGAVPDPQDPATFERSRLRWDERAAPEHAGILALYRDLLAVRRTLHGADHTAVAHGTHGLELQRGRVHLLVALAPGLTLPRPANTTVVLHTEQPLYAAAPSPPDVGPTHVRLPSPAAIFFR